MRGRRKEIGTKKRGGNGERVLRQERREKEREE